MPAPIFLPFYRTSVRYNEFRCDCVRVVYSIRYVRLCASRLSSRHVVLSCVSSRAIRCVVSSVGSFRPSFRSPSCLAPFRSAVRSFSSRLPWRDCLAFPCRLVSHWHPVCPSSRSSSCRSVSHAVSSCSSRSRSSSRSRRPGGGVRVRFHACSPCSHRSALLVARSCSSIWSRSMSPLWGGAVRHVHGAGTACSYRLIRPIIALTRYSLTRCGMAAGG